MVYQVCSNDNLMLTFDLLWQGQICIPVHLYGENVEKSVSQNVLKTWLKLTYDKEVKGFSYDTNFVPWGVICACPLAIYMYEIVVAPACSRVRYGRPLFRPSVYLSTFMSTFDIYVKVSIPINYKTKQPSNLAWNISLTSWPSDIGARFSVRLSVNSSVMSKFDIYVEISILINYKTKKQSNLAWNISLTSWLCDIGIRFSVRLSICPSVNIYVEVWHLCQS